MLLSSPNGRFLATLTVAAASLALAWTRIGCAESLQADAPGCSDPTNLPRFEGAQILGCQTKDSAEAILPLSPWNDDPDVAFWDNSLRLEGRRSQTLYVIPAGRSPQEVERAYRKALVDQGYKVLFECSGFTACGAGVDTVYADDAYGKRLPNAPASGAFAQDTVREPRILMAKGPGADNTPYVLIFAAYQRNAAEPKAGDRVAVFVEGVISQGGQQPMVVLTADELAQEIDFDGHVPVYGIYFDPGMADIKPESDEQIEQIARLMRLRPDLSFHVVGHTDSQGDVGQNLDLSRRRAQAVVDVLIREFAIAPARLTPHGLASLAPVGPNTLEEGRAMNRRIELVVR